MSQFQKYLRVFVLGMFYASSMALPYIHLKFYDIIRSITETTNAELGYLMTVFIGVTMFSAMPGGLLANKISARKLIVFSSLCSCIANLVFAFYPSYFVGLCIWGFCAFAISTAWPSAVRTVRETGSKDEQGKMFGFFYGAQGFVMVIIGLLDAFIYKLFPNPHDGFKYMLIYQAIMLLLTVATVLFVIKDTNQDSVVNNQNNKSSFANTMEVLKSLRVWVLIILVFCGYGCYVGMGYLTPYTTNVLGASVSLGAILGTIRVYGIKVLAGPISGVIADRLGASSKLMLICFVALLVFLLLLIKASFFSNNIILVLTMVMSFFSLMLFSIMFAGMEELKVPAHQTGIVVGLITMLGYLPNAIFPPLFGYWLDKYGDIQGYTVIFEFLSVLTVIGIVSAITIYKMGKRASRS